MPQFVNVKSLFLYALMRLLMPRSQVVVPFAQPLNKRAKIVEHGRVLGNPQDTVMQKV